jgi:hypothetical protein
LHCERHYLPPCRRDFQLSYIYQTCKPFSLLCEERSLWTALFNRMMATQPLHCSQSEIEAMSVPDIELALFAAFQVEKSFLMPRQYMKRIMPSSNADEGSLRYLSFVRDRFLLSVDHTMAISLWDIPEHSSSTMVPSHPCARVSLPSWHLLTHSLSIDRSTLYIAVTQAKRSVILDSCVTIISDKGLSHSEPKFIPSPWTRTCQMQTNTSCHSISSRISTCSWRMPSNA